MSLKNVLRSAVNRLGFDVMDSHDCSTRLVSATQGISTRPMVRMGGWRIWMQFVRRL